MLALREINAGWLTTLLHAERSGAASRFAEFVCRSQAFECPAKNANTLDGNEVHAVGLGFYDFHRLRLAVHVIRIASTSLLAGLSTVAEDGPMAASASFCAI